MKKILFVLLIGCSLNVAAQVRQVAEVVPNNQAEEEAIGLLVIEEVPVFPGCENLGAKEARECFQQKLMEHIRKNMKYPVEAISEKIEGRVIASFIIDKEGTVTAISARGPHPALENETRRILSLVPKMQAGKDKGKKVDCKFSVPIQFRMQ